jgi:hypothetical protein
MLQLSDVERRLREGLSLDKSVLKVLHANSIKSTTATQSSKTLKFSVKDNDEQEVAIIEAVTDRSIIKRVLVHPKQDMSKVSVEIFRIELIEDLFSSSDSTAIKQRLVYKRDYEDIDLLAHVNLDNLPPSLTIINTPIFKVFFALHLVIDDSVSCSIQVR